MELGHRGLVLLIGAVVRHFFNTKHKTGQHLWWCWAVAGVLFVLVMALSGAPGWRASPTGEASSTSNANLDFPADPQLALARSPLFQEAEGIVQSRCSMCHARKPLWPGMGHAPKGVLLENGRDIVLNASLIERQAVRSHAMPPAISPAWSPPSAWRWPAGWKPAAAFIGLEPISAHSQSLDSQI